MQEIQILFLASSPRGEAKLNLDREMRAVEDKIRASEHRDSLKLVQKWAARPDDLIQAANELSPTIVHYSGHGSADHELLMQGDDNLPKPVSAEALKHLFSKLFKKTRVVFMNACHSHGQATAVTEVVDCAIGMSKAVKDSVAITFAASFYRAIGFGKSVQEAFDQGIIACDLGGATEQIPQLMCKEGVDASTVYLLEPEATSGHGVSAEWMRLAPRPPALKEGQKYNVFLSYRSVNRPWVLNLYDVLREHGYEVFLDQVKLKAGTELVESLQDGLTTSASGVLVWSKSAADSEWCRHEYETMEKLSKEGDFHFVPIKLDGTELPEFARGRIFLDFANQPDGPNGGELLRLLHALAGMPLSEAAAHFASKQDEEAAAAMAVIKAAIKTGSRRALVSAFEDAIEKGSLPWTTSATLGCRVAEGLTRIGEYEDALSVIATLEERFPKAIRPRQLHAHALSRRGSKADIEAAGNILGTLEEEGHKDPETLGLFGRVWMDRYAKERKTLYLRKSRDCYATAFEGAGDDYYVGINAAAKSVFLEELEDGRAIAAKVQAVLEEQDEKDYWSLATRGEVALIQGDYKAAGKAYMDAVLAAPEESGSHESTWKQARRLRKKIGIGDADWKPIREAFEDYPDDEF